MKSMKNNIDRVIVARLEMGEDLYKALSELALRKGIKAASLTVIGAVNAAKLGVYEGGKYEYMEHAGALEIASCTGNVTLKEGKPLVHAHAVLTDHKGNVLGGHLVEGCTVSPTAEVVMNILKHPIERAYDEESKLWLMNI